MAADFDAILTGLVNRFIPAAVTPPTGLQNVRFATGDLPNKIAVTPGVLVMLEGGSYESGNTTRKGTHKAKVRFYYAQNTDLRRDLVSLRKWLTVLVDQTKGAVQLGGVAYVTSVVVADWTIGKLPYATDEFTGIELGVDIVTSEPWAATA